MLRGFSQQISQILAPGGVAEGVELPGKPAPTGDRTAVSVVLVSSVKIIN